MGVACVCVDVCVWMCECGCARKCLTRRLCVHTRRCGRKSLGAAWRTTGSPRLCHSHALHVCCTYDGAGASREKKHVHVCHFSLIVNCVINITALSSSQVRCWQQNRQSSGVAGLAAQHSASLRTSFVFASAKTTDHHGQTPRICKTSNPQSDGAVAPGARPSPASLGHRHNLSKHVSRALTNTATAVCRDSVSVHRVVGRPTSYGWACPCTRDQDGLHAFNCAPLPVGRRKGGGGGRAWQGQAGWLAALACSLVIVCIHESTCGVNLLAKHTAQHSAAAHPSRGAVGSTFWTPALV